MLTREEIIQKLREILLETCGEAQANKPFTEQSRLMEDMGLTSVDMLYLIIATEESFGIRFENVKIMDMNTLSAVVDYILERQK